MWPVWRGQLEKCECHRNLHNANRYWGQGLQRSTRLVTGSNVSRQGLALPLPSFLMPWTKSPVQCQHKWGRAAVRCRAQHSHYCTSQKWPCCETNPSSVCGNCCFSLKKEKNREKREKAQFFLKENPEQSLIAQKISQKLHQHVAKKTTLLSLAQTVRQKRHEVLFVSK